MKEKETGKEEISFYVFSVILFAISFVPILNDNRVLVYLCIILLSGYELIWEGIKNIFKLNFEEETLMTIAVIAAFAIGEYPESCMIILLFKLGEFLQDKAVKDSNKNIEDIVSIKAKTANLINKNGNIETVNVDRIKVSDIILVKPGEMVPLDCKIIEGSSSLDMSSLTGESMLVDVGKNENILSGSINLNGSLTCIVTKDYKNSTASQIVDLVYEAQNNKGKTEEFINKFSKVYTPIVILFAIVIAILPPIIIQQEFRIWFMRALVFIVAACPCSIVISVPLAFFSCIGISSKKGLLIKGTKHIEDLAEVKYIAFDKTGTITTGEMEVDNIVAEEGFTEQEVLKYMYALEKNSNHPISTAIKKKIESEKIEVEYVVTDYEEIAGYGIKAEVNEKQILFGNSKLLKRNNINVEKQNTNYLIIDEKLAGLITFKEEIRPNIKDTINELKQANIKEIIMLTGDNLNNANKIAEKVGITKVFAGLLPQEKLQKVKELKQNGKVIFIGDGINDSPVLLDADFGISMGDSAEIAENSADGVLMSNNMRVLPDVIKKAKKTMKIVKFNIAFSLIVKAIVLILGTLGYAPMWLAVVADTGVSLLTVLNCVRIFN